MIWTKSDSFIFGFILCLGVFLILIALMKATDDPEEEE